MSITDWTANFVPIGRGALAAGASGAVLLAVAVYIWRSAARRFRQLIDRTRTLERDLASSAMTIVLLMILSGGLFLIPGEAMAQELSPAAIEMRASGAPIPWSDHSSGSYQD